MSTTTHPWYTPETFRTARELIEAQCRKFKERILFQFNEGEETTSKTYAEFWQDITALGTAFYERGIRKARTAIAGNNSYEWAVAFFASICGGNTVVPLNNTLPKESALRQIEHSDSTVLIYAKELASLAHDANVKLRIGMSELSELIEEGKELIRQGVRDFQDHLPDPEELALIMYTSGTTGDSKGVTLTHATITRQTDALCRALDFSGKNMISLPLYHIFALVLGLFVFPVMGSMVFINGEIKRLLSDVRSFGPRTLFLVPMLIEALCKRASGMSNDEAKEFMGGNLEQIINGGAVLDYRFVTEMKKYGVEARNAYGMTEACLGITGQRDTETSPGSLGTPFEGVKLRIHKPDKDGNGEILVNADWMTKYYHKNPEATRQSIRNGWFHTGDLGKLDEHGALYITGRIKNLIILSNGENVSPEELETPLMRSEYVAECIVHEHNGFIAATIYPNQNYASELQISRDEVHRRISAHTHDLNRQRPRAKHIHKVILSDSPLPRTASGKIKRF
ncbi:AMP-binding protein [Desulfovibrio sp. OttesenSCG-928-C06]|nr:AMP-binding protein [Desulfovibrio sp. OttesenSCG-928-C06]